MQTLETPEVKKIQKNIEKEKVGIIRIIDYTSRGDSLETNLELLLDDENRFPVKFNGYVGEILIGTLPVLIDDLVDDGPQAFGKGAGHAQNHLLISFSTASPFGGERGADHCSQPSALPAKGR